MQDFQDECFEEGFFNELDKLVEEHLHTKASLSQTSPASQATGRPRGRGVRRSPAALATGREGGLKLVPSPSSGLQSGSVQPSHSNITHGNLYAGFPPREVPHGNAASALEPLGYPSAVGDGGARRGALFGARQPGPSGGSLPPGRRYPPQQMVPDGSWPAAGGLGNRGSNVSSSCSQSFHLRKERLGAPAQDPAGQNANPNVAQGLGRPGISTGSGVPGPQGASIGAMPAGGPSSKSVQAIQDVSMVGRGGFGVEGPGLGWAGPSLAPASSSVATVHDVIVLEPSLDPAEELLQAHILGKPSPALATSHERGLDATGSFARPPVKSSWPEPISQDVDVLRKRLQEQEGEAAALRSKLEQAHGEQRALETRLNAVSTANNAGGPSFVGGDASGHLRTLQEQLAFKEQEMLEERRRNVERDERMKAAEAGKRALEEELRRARDAQLQLAAELEEARRERKKLVEAALESQHRGDAAENGNTILNGGATRAGSAGMSSQPLKQATPKGARLSSQPPRQATPKGLPRAGSAGAPSSQPKQATPRPPSRPASIAVPSVTGGGPMPLSREPAQAAPMQSETVRAPFLPALGVGGSPCLLWQSMWAACGDALALLTAEAVRPVSRETRSGVRQTLLEEQAVWGRDFRTAQQKAVAGSGDAGMAIRVSLQSLLEHVGARIAAERERDVREKGFRDCGEPQGWPEDELGAAACRVLQNLETHVSTCSHCYQADGPSTSTDAQRPWILRQQPWPSGRRKLCTRLSSRVQVLPKAAEGATDSRPDLFATSQTRESAGAERPCGQTGGPNQAMLVLQELLGQVAGTLAVILRDAPEDGPLFQAAWQLLTTLGLLSVSDACQGARQALCILDVLAEAVVGGTVPPSVLPTALLVLLQEGPPQSVPIQEALQAAPQGRPQNHTSAAPMELDSSPPPPGQAAGVREPPEGSRQPGKTWKDARQSCLAVLLGALAPPPDPLTAEALPLERANSGVEALEGPLAMLPVVALLLERGDEAALLHLLAEGTGSDVDGGGGLAQRLVGIAGAALRGEPGTVLASFRLPKALQGGFLESFFVGVDPTDLGWKSGLLTAQAALTLLRALLATDSLRLAALQDLTASSASFRHVLIVTGRLQSCKTPSERVSRVQGEPLPLPTWLVGTGLLFLRSRSAALPTGQALSDGSVVASLALTIRRHVLQHLEPRRPALPT